MPCGVPAALNSAQTTRFDVEAIAKRVQDRDFPTADCPAYAETFPCIRECSAPMPCPSEAQTDKPDSLTARIGAQCLAAAQDPSY
jgi:hypothetical protein